MTSVSTLRLNDIKLPLAHSAAELTAAVLTALSVAPGELQDVAVYKRSYDARKKSDIQLIYSLDVRLCDAARERVLAANAGSTKIMPSPDTTYKFVARANADFPDAGQQRPLIIGFGPCGILAALVLAQMVPASGQQRGRARVAFQPA